MSFLVPGKQEPGRYSESPCMGLRQRMTPVTHWVHPGCYEISVTLKRTTSIKSASNVKLAFNAFKFWLCAIWPRLSVVSTLQMYIESSLNINSIPNYFECVRCSHYEIMAAIREQ